MNFKNKKEIDEYFIKLWDLPKKDYNDIKFDYPFKLIYDLSYFENKIFKIKDINVLIKNIIINKKTGRIEFFDIENNKYTGASNSFLIEYNPITKEKEEIKFIFLIEKGYFVNQKTLKQYWYKTEEYKSNKKDSIIKKYGDYEKYKKIKDEKSKKTMKQKYGVEYFFCRGEHYKKIEDIMIERYGDKIPIKNKEIKNKIFKTIKEKYNVNSFLTRGEHYKKIEDIMIERYGFSNLFYSFEWQEKIREKNGKNISSEIESIILKEIYDIFKFKNCLFYAKDQKQFIVENYYCDFYDFDLNLVIEIYGDFWHCNPQIYNSDFINPISKIKAKDKWQLDLERKNNIINSINCNYIEIWVSEWPKEKEKIINYINYLKSN